MPLVKIHVSSDFDQDRRKPFVDDIREAIVETLGIKPDHGHVILYDAPVDSRSVHEGRDSNFVFFEILMFAGRTDETKEKLFKELSDIAERYTGVNNRDIIINIIETDRKEWAARGGIPLSKVDLGY
jgi:phenylpyruvate tautomerase PptA (4-oxalocrotonate tautomerase family)